MLVVCVANIDPLWWCKTVVFGCCWLMEAMAAGGMVKASCCSSGWVVGLAFSCEWVRIMVGQVLVRGFGFVFVTPMRDNPALALVATETTEGDLVFTKTCGDEANDVLVSGFRGGVTILVFMDTGDAIDDGRFTET